MRWYSLLVFSLLLLLPLSQISAYHTSPIFPTTNLEEELLSDLWIAPNDYEYLLINLDEGTHFYGRYFTNTVGDLSFFICDSENLTGWMIGNEAITRIWDHEYFYSGAFAITIPSGVWYIVVENYEDYSMIIHSRF